ncbi:MAG: hypothetical protein PWP17_525 [Desulfomicrobiaceae bacterium]|nr:hypothetical protein [Desulfomicrobiaceae bacterium]
MEKGRPMRWVGILCLSLGVAGFGLNALGGKQEGTPEPGGAGLILIDTLAASGKLSYPVVRFDHDKHTKAVENKCASCHTVTEGSKVTPLFKRQADEDPGRIKSIYHDNCIGCHQQTVEAGKKGGPQSGECRLCHAGPQGSVREVIPFDKSLHYRHASSKMVQPAPGQKENCSKCHTQDTPEKRNLVFAKNKEEAHAKCISCHMEIALAKQPTGPLECAGCHDVAKRSTYKVVADVPRLEAGQTDAMLLVAPAPKSAAKDAPRSVVAFDHKAHEAKVNRCSACHHDARSQGVPACSQCHTPGGKEDGAFITMEQAMHRPMAMESCIGCHNAKKAEPQCAGCHEFLGRTTKSQEGACAKCHVEMPLPDGVEQNKALRNSLAQTILESKPKKDTALRLDEIPEVVEIGSLSKEYQPSKFPHRKVVKKIAEGMENNTLAAYFHSAPNAMCAGCHHNAPASANPPACASCHSKEFQEVDGLKPSLKTAYHQQCMGCHKQMGIQKPADTACVECHAKKE